jgi:hypothetical protein
MNAVKVAHLPPVRNLCAILAATDWPEREQKPLPRGVHPEAASLRKHVSTLGNHPAIQHVQTMLERGPELGPLFAQALNGSSELVGLVRSFARAASLETYWQEHDAVWVQSAAEVQKQVEGLPLQAFLVELFDIVPYELIIHPNLAYPTTHSFGVRAGNALYSIMPPRKAVGESKPWPFGDDRDYVVRLAVHDFVQAYLNDLTTHHPNLIPAGENNDLLPPDFQTEHPTWKRQVIELFAYGAQIIFLNRVSDGAGDAFAMFERRTRGLNILPDVVAELTNYVAGRGVSQRYASIAAYLPTFADLVDQMLYDAKV